MLSHFRTLATGTAGLAVCLILQSASWLYVLLFFGMAGLVWSLHSLLKESRLRSEKERWQNRKAMSEKSRRQRTLDNLYRFPQAGWSELHEALE